MQYNNNPINLDSDVIIIGAGMAGTIAANLLAKQKKSVILIDKQEYCPQVFRAEKLEVDQVVLLKKFGLLNERRPIAPIIGDNINYTNGVISTDDTVEQYGIRYHDTINQLRKCTKNLVNFKVSVVKDVQSNTFNNSKMDDKLISNTYQQVILDNGEILKSHLVIFACGYKSPLLTNLGFKYNKQSDLTSLSFGFDIEKKDRQDFAFRSFGYYLNLGNNDIDYLTIFLIGDIMRVNLFTQFKTSDPKVKALRTSPYETLIQYFPDLIKKIGDFNVTSKVEIFSTQYYQMEKSNKRGLVVIGDSYQSVSPTTGTGLSKVLNDVDVLCNHFIPKWFSNSNFDVESINNFYQYKQKLKTDNHSFQTWQWYRDSALRNTWLNQLKRSRLATWIKKNILYK